MLTTSPRMCGGGEGVRAAVGREGGREAIGDVGELPPGDFCAGLGARTGTAGVGVAVFTGFPRRPKISSFASLSVTVPAIGRDCTLRDNLLVELVAASKSSNISNGLTVLAMGALACSVGFGETAGESMSKSQGSLEVF